MTMNNINSLDPNVIKLNVVHNVIVNILTIVIIG